MPHEKSKNELGCWHTDDIWKCRRSWSRSYENLILPTWPWIQVLLGGNKPAESISEHFGHKPLERSLGSHLSSDFNTQTDTDDNSDTSCWMMTSNRDRHRDKAQWQDQRRVKRGGQQKTNRGKLSLPIYQDSHKDKPSNMTTGIAKWMPSYSKDTPNERLRWLFWMPWRVGQRGQRK